ncbi:hypothetical protein Ntsu_23030 [Nocardia sp. IFM 10818]
MPPGLDRGLFGEPLDRRGPVLIESVQLTQIHDFTDSDLRGRSLFDPPELVEVADVITVDPERTCARWANGLVEIDNG